MTVSLIRVRSLTWATVRPARWRASAKAAPINTLRLHSSAAPQPPPQPGGGAIPSPSFHAIPRRIGCLVLFAASRPVSGPPHAHRRPGPGAERLRRRAWAGRCDAGDQLHDLRGRTGGLPVRITLVVTGPQLGRAHAEIAKPVLGWIFLAAGTPDQGYLHPAVNAVHPSGCPLILGELAAWPPLSVISSALAQPREPFMSVRADPASRSAPKIGHRRSQNRTIRTRVIQHDRKSER
jgi:hypothetical protein